MDTANNYNGTEKLMLKLSFIAYVCLFGDDLTIKNAVEKTLAKITPGQRLVWGPAIGHKKSDSPKRPNYALMYIVQDEKTKEYTVVVRGTNPFSLGSWLEQDLNVRHKVLWRRESPFSLVSDASISAAANKSLRIHKNLLYPDDAPGGKTFFEFLKEKMLRGEQLTINFTGHSLGGLMASTLGLWFYDMLGSRELLKFKEQTGIHVYTFAGPTAGDVKFASYSDNSLPPPLPNPLPSSKYCTRYVNEADVAVNAWNINDLKKIFTFYGKAVSASKLINGVFLCLSGIVKHMAYTQLSNKIVVAEYKDVLNVKGLDDIDLEIELGLKDNFPLHVFYRQRILNIDVKDEDIEEDINKTLTWLLVAIYQHILPYIFNILSDNHESSLIINDIIFPLIEETYPKSNVKDVLKHFFGAPLEA